MKSRQAAALGRSLGMATVALMLLVASAFSPNTQRAFGRPVSTGSQTVQTQLAATVERETNPPPTQSSMDDLLRERDAAELLAPTGTWTPGAGTVYTFPVTTTHFNLSAQAQLGFAPNLASAGFLLFNPTDGSTTGYTATATAIAGGARLTATNVPLLASGQEIQFFISPQGGGSPDFSPRYTMLRLSMTFLPLVGLPGLLESNNTACEATDASPNTIYTGQNDDVYDWFKISLGSRADVSLTLTGFNVLGYLELWTSNGSCDNLTFSRSAILPPNANPVMVIHDLAAGTYYVRIVSTQFDKATYQFSWTYAAPPSELEPNNTPCEATLATAGTHYVGRDDDQYDWFKLVVTTQGTVAITVTGFGSAGFMDFFPATNGDCNNVNTNPSSTVALNTVQTAVTIPGVTPSTYYVRIRATGANSNLTYTFVWTTGVSNFEIEPNNTVCQAQLLNLNQNYQAYVNDTEDWFYVDIPADNGVVQFVVTDMPLAGQPDLSQPQTMRVDVTLFRQAGDCNTTLQTMDDEGNWVNIRNRAIPGRNWLMGVQQVQGGRYLVRVRSLPANQNDPNSPPGFNNTQPYRFFATRGIASVWSPRYQNAPCYNCAGTVIGDIVTAYWWGINGGSIQFTLEGRGCGANCGCPVGTSGGSTTQNAEFGNHNFTGIARGYYALKVNANGPGYPSPYTDERPVKVQCEFLNGYDPATDPAFNYSLAGPPTPTLESR